MQETAEGDNVPIPERRFHQLETRVNEIAERLARLEGGAQQGTAPRTDWKAWLPVGAPMATLAVIVLTIALHFDGKLGNIQKDLQTYGVRLGKVESAVKVLADNQKDSLKQIIHDLLAIARTSNPPNAARAIQTVAALTQALKNQKQAADATFFQETVSTIDSLERTFKQPQVTQASFKASQELAEYRSALEIVRTASKNASRCDLNLSGDSAYSPTTMLPPQMGDGKTVRNVELVDCPQILDGYTWDGVVFVNGRIGYRGGKVILKNVVFINCTFARVKPGDAGLRILQYAALSEKELTINPDGLGRPPIGGM